MLTDECKMQDHSTAQESAEAEPPYSGIVHETPAIVVESLSRNDEQNSLKSPELSEAADEQSQADISTTIVIQEASASSNAHAHPGEDEPAATEGSTTAGRDPINTNQESRSEVVIDSVTRLQELQAIKEIIAVQAENYDRQMKHKAEKLRAKYEQKMASLQQQTEEIIAHQVNVERDKIIEEFHQRYQNQLQTLQEQFEVHFA